MKIESVEAVTLHIPLSRPLYVGAKEYNYRDHVLVTIRTDEGVTGFFRNLWL